MLVHRFRITKDRIAMPEFGEKSMAGKEFLFIQPTPDHEMMNVSSKTLATEYEGYTFAPYTKRFRLLDADSEVYYYGEASEEIDFEPLEWAQPYAGCTEMQIRDAGGKYKRL